MSADSSSYSGDGAIPGKYWATTTSVLDMAASYTRRVLPQLSLEGGEQDDDWDEWTDVTGSGSSGCCSEWSDEEETSSKEVVKYSDCECQQCARLSGKEALSDEEATASCVAVTPLCLSDEEGHVETARDETPRRVQLSQERRKAILEVLVGSDSESKTVTGCEVRAQHPLVPDRDRTENPVVLRSRIERQEKTERPLPTWAGVRREYVLPSRRNRTNSFSCREKEAVSSPTDLDSRSATDIEASLSRPPRFPPGSQFLSFRLKTANKRRERQRHCSLDDTETGAYTPIGSFPLPERRERVNSDSARIGQHRHAFVSREIDRQSYLFAVDPSAKNQKKTNYANLLRAIFTKPTVGSPANARRSASSPAMVGEGDAKSPSKSLRVSSSSPPPVAPSQASPNAPYSPFDRASPQRRPRRISSNTTTPVHRPRRLPPTPRYPEVPPLYANLRTRPSSLPRSVSSPASDTRIVTPEPLPRDCLEETPRKTPNILLGKQSTERETASLSNVGEVEKTPSTQSMRRRLAKRRNPLVPIKEPIGQLNNQKARLDRTTSQSVPNGLNSIIPLDDLEQLKTKDLSPKRRPAWKELPPPPPVKPMYKDITQLDIRHIAEELALIDAELLQKIECHELSNCAWIHKDRNIRAPNIMTMVDAFNRLALITTSEVLKKTTTAERAKVVGFFIKIADQCLKLHNYNSLKAILAGLQCTPMFRLKKTWKEVSAAKKKRFTELSDLMSEAKNYGLYRRSMAEALSRGACIPFLGVFLTQVVQIESYIMLQSKMRRSRRLSRRASKRRMSTRQKASNRNRNRPQVRLLSQSAETLVIPQSPSPKQVTAPSPTHLSVDSGTHSPVHTSTSCHLETNQCNSLCHSCCSTTCNNCCNSTCNNHCLSTPVSSSSTRDQTSVQTIHPSHGVGHESMKTADNCLGMSPSGSDHLSGKGEGMTGEDSAYGSDGSTHTNSLCHHSRESSADGSMSVVMSCPEIVVDMCDKEEMNHPRPPGALTPNTEKSSKSPPSISPIHSLNIPGEPSVQSTTKSQNGTIPLIRGKLQAVLGANSAKNMPKGEDSPRPRASSRASVCADGGMQAAFSSLEEQLECYKKASQEFGHCSRPWVRYFLEHVEYNTEETNYKLSLQREPKVPQTRTWLARFSNR